MRGARWPDCSLGTMMCVSLMTITVHVKVRLLHHSAAVQARTHRHTHTRSLL